MDIGTVLDKIRPGAAYRLCNTYENLVATWEDTTACPTEAELEAAWAEIQNATIQSQLTAAVQAHMDTKAREKGYDGILSAVSYADDATVPQFQKEGKAYRSWRGAVWQYCYAQVAAVLSGEREAPTAEQLIAELPALELPEA